MFKLKNAARTSIFTALLIAKSVHTAMASGSVTSALNSADTTIRSAFEPISRIMYGVMAIIGIVGAISVYGKWSNGDPDTRKSAAAWFGALIFAGLVLLVIRAVFTVA
jgi:hypothetical protein